MRASLVVGVLLLSLPRFAFAQIDLAWDECGEAGVRDKMFTCDDNSTLHVLVPSFVLADSLPEFVGTTAQIIIAGNFSGFPAWWEFDAGACRSGMVSTVSTGQIGLTECDDPFEGTITTSYVNYFPDRMGRPNRRLMFADHIVVPGIGGTLIPGRKYAAGAVQIRSNRTVGTSGVCSGCIEPICLTLVEVQVFSFGSGPSPVLTGSSSVTWQGGLIDDPTSECAPVGNRRQTWGAVKSLYR